MVDVTGGPDEVWEVLASEEVFAARPYVAVHRERIRTPAGFVVDDFYRVELADFALCVPQTPDGRIVTLRQYKHGARRFALSFPAGLLDPGEAPDVTCRRELMEETGYAAGSLETLGSYIDNGNQRGAQGHYYIARGCVLQGEPVVDALEAGEVQLMTPPEIDAALAAGEFVIIHHVAAWGLARMQLA